MLVAAAGALAKAPAAVAAVWAAAEVILDQNKKREGCLWEVDCAIWFL